MREVNRNIAFTSWTLWYECYMNYPEERVESVSNVATGGEVQLSQQLNNQRRRSIVAPGLAEKRKKVYCYLTPKVNQSLNEIRSSPC